jgi:hypothetical protein
MESTRQVSVSDAAKVLALVAPDAKFGTLSGPQDHDESVIHVDGAQWIVEGLDGSVYHVVDRWSPRDCDIYEIGVRLMARSGRDFGPVY